MSADGIFCHSLSTMPELFEIEAFAAMVTASLTSRPQEFTVVIHPEHCGRNTINNLAEVTAALGSPLVVQLTKEDVSAYGKELILRIAPDWVIWVIVCHFALHGHIVILSPEELQMAEVCREAGLPPFIPLVLEATSWSHHSIAIVDRNKIARLTFNRLHGQAFEHYRTPGRGSCPVKDTAEFEEAVRSIATKGHIKRNFSPVAHYIYTQ